MEEANAAMKEPPKVVLRCKLCMVGDAAVGKTALTEVYTKGGSKFPKNYSMVRLVPPPHRTLATAMTCCRRRRRPPTRRSPCTWWIFRTRICGWSSASSMFLVTCMPGNRHWLWYALCC